MALCALLSACSPDKSDPPSQVEPPVDAPYILVLGTAQDAGLPQIGCTNECCERVRRDPAQRRFTTSLLLADPRSGRRWLFEAGPDLPLQVELAHGHPEHRSEPASSADGRQPLFDGVFLTHAHMGHYLGLAHLGREAYGAGGQRVWATARMAAFLRDNGPWGQLVSMEQIALAELVPDEPIRLAPDLVVTALRVPHRDEYSDTVAFRIEGPTRSLLFIPDIDKWERWDRAIEEQVGTVDYALLDGSFFADGEIPGRAMADIPHPFMEETIARFSDAPAGVGARVRFLHLNHTNPAARSDSEARRTVRAAGMDVAREGDLFGL